MDIVLAVVLDVTIHVIVVVGKDTIVVVVVLADSVLNFVSVVIGVAAAVDVDEVVNVSAVFVKVILQIIVIKWVK